MMQRLRCRPLVLALTVAVSALAPVSLKAQGGAEPPPRQGAQARPPRSAADSIQARKDSIKNEPLVRWVPADSIGLEMMGRKGYQLVRYQSQRIVFGASTHTIRLVRGKDARAAVQRDPSLLLADTIEYADSSKLVFAAVSCGDTITIHDPARNEDIERQLGVARGRDGEKRHDQDVDHAARRPNIVVHVSQ